jgi:transposase
VSVLIEREIEDRPISHKKSVGIDVGIKEFACLSVYSGLDRPPIPLSTDRSFR